MKNCFSRTCFSSPRLLLAFCGVFLMTMTLAIPTTTQAITQLSCLTGYTLKFRDVGSFMSYVGAPNYQHWCQSSDGKTTLPETEEVPSCGTGYSKVLDGYQLPPLVTQEVCAPVSVSQAPVSCAGTLDTIKNPGVCITRALFAGLASLFMGLGILLATLAGKLFEFVLQHAIVGFATTLASIQSGIEIGWSAFRDVANIVIIGMFVFTAINIILGVKEFGQKKTIAKILIIAVLINFSLLFTKMIIDASNFTAYQFYNSMVKGQEATTDKEARDAAAEAAKNPTSLSAPTASPTKDIDKGAGIAARFMQLLGVQGVGDSYNILREIQESQDNALLGLMYGFLSFVFLIGVAFVFSYGAFLIVTRAILFVFLMLTSAVAFASWLIPYQVVEHAWSSWWKTLIKTALFGPILMIFLWMTAKISAELAHTGEGTLGALAANASSDANIGALFSFVLILGLLFASFKAASYFSHSISGFSAAGMIPGVGLGVLARATGWAGRTAIGRPALAGFRGMKSWVNRTDDVDAQGNVIRSYAGRRSGVVGFLNSGILRGTGGLSRRTFDPLSPKPMQTFAKTVGVPGGLIGATSGLGKGGVVGVVERKAARADEVARAIGPSEAQRQEARRQDELRTAQQGQALGRIVSDQRTALARERPQAEIRARQNQPERQGSEDRAQAHEEALQRIANQRDTVRSRQQSEMRAARTQIERATLQARHEAELNGLDERERGHNEDLAATREAITALNTAAHDMAEADLQPFNAGIQEAQHNLEEFNSGASTAIRNAEHNRDTALRNQLLWDPQARGAVEKAMQTHRRREVVRDFVVANREELRHERAAGGAPPEAPAQAPPANP